MTMTFRRRLRNQAKGFVVQSQLLMERSHYLWTQRPSTQSSILLVGSGRSGTTWLMDAITASGGIQQIFEPLNPRWVREVTDLTGWPTHHPHVRSYYLRPSLDDARWHDFLRRMLQGEVRNFWTDPDRTAIWPRRYLIKLIRANLMLGYLYDHFQPAIVYLLRHPCAVIESRLRREWYADIADLLSQEALVEDHLRPWLPQIEAEKDELGAHAVWWAVENFIAQHDLQTRPHCKIYYEHIVARPEMEVARVYQDLGLELPADIMQVMRQPARHSRHLSGLGAAADRLDRWKTQLALEDQQRILTWAQRLGVRDYDDKAMPIYPTVGEAKNEKP